MRASVQTPVLSRNARFLQAARILVVVVAVSAWASEQNPQAIFDRAIADFQSGRLAESAAGFDSLARLAPATAPQLWQRGIVLYYVGRYADCRAQFESHRTVNPNDVENAAWHFLCAARAESPERARAVLLPVGPDPRAPMREIYQMFRGTLDPASVLAAAGAQCRARFYAQLYLGLYFEALGDEARALKHIRAAAADRYAAVGGYMHMVARVHLVSRGASPVADFFVQIGRMATAGPRKPWYDAAKLVSNSNVRRGRCPGF